MNTLYTTTAVIEVGAGLALLCLPSAAAEILLGAPLEASASLAVARIGGTALVADYSWYGRVETRPYDFLACESPAPCSRSAVEQMIRDLSAFCRLSSKES